MSHHEPRHALTVPQRSGETERLGCTQTVGYIDEQGRVWGPSGDGSCYRIVTPGPEWEPGCYCDQDIRTAAGEGWELTTQALYRSGYETVRDVFRATRDSDEHILEIDRTVKRDARKMIVSPKRIWLLVGRLMRREREFNEWKKSQGEA